MDHIVIAMEICKSKKGDEIPKQRQYKIESGMCHKKGLFINSFIFHSFNEHLLPVPHLIPTQENEK